MSSELIIEYYNNRPRTCIFLGLPMAFEITQLSKKRICYVATYRHTTICHDMNQTIAVFDTELSAPVIYKTTCRNGRQIAIHARE